MADAGELDCTIYVEAELGQNELAGVLAKSLQGQVAGIPAAPSVHTQDAEIDVRRNTQADHERARTFPDGFLYFRHALEIYPESATSREQRVALVVQTLRLLWSHGWPAVAACAYEGDLPAHGGYRDASVPWPPAATALPLTAQPADPLDTADRAAPSR
jgi:hypothetical protein